jgi:hypothetical protein
VGTGASVLPQHTTRQGLWQGSAAARSTGAGIALKCSHVCRARKGAEREGYMMCTGRSVCPTQAEQQRRGQLKIQT